MNFDTLIGKRFTLYKNNGINQFQLDNILYEVVEDESDGYRSMMEEVRILNPYETQTNKELIGEIVVCERPDQPIYQLVSTKDKHVWCEFGTDDYYDYYPCFLFKWNPKIG